MSDITTQTIDQQVQATLKDWRVSPWKRAHIAIQMIEDHVRTEHGLADDVTLPVPLEWEHRVAGMAEPVEKMPTLLVESNHGEPVQITTLPPDEDLKDAFRAKFDGDEEEAQAKIDKFWKWGR